MPTAILQSYTCLLLLFFPIKPTELSHNLLSFHNFYLLTVPMSFFRHCSDSWCDMSVSDLVSNRLVNWNFLAIHSHCVLCSCPQETGHCALNAPPCVGSSWFNPWRVPWDTTFSVWSKLSKKNNYASICDTYSFLDSRERVWDASLRLTSLIQT